MFAPRAAREAAFAPKDAVPTTAHFPTSMVTCFLASLFPSLYPSHVPFKQKRAARKLTTEDELYAAAMRALMRRGFSISEMRQTLERKAEDVALVVPVLARLKEHKYLDDARYALNFARTRATIRKQGRFRIARELRARGVPDRHIEAAFEEAFAETSEEDLLKKRLARKLKLIRGPLDARKRASLYNNLLRAGFSSDLIRKAMRGVSITWDGGDSNELPNFEQVE
jgi:regulatory protein